VITSVDPEKYLSKQYLLVVNAEHTRNKDNFINPINQNSSATRIKSLSLDNCHCFSMTQKDSDIPSFAQMTFIEGHRKEGRKEGRRGKEKREEGERGGRENSPLEFRYHSGPSSISLGRMLPLTFVFAYTKEQMTASRQSPRRLNDQA
jgi:hypothetical protein